MTSQQHADHLLSVWQARRHLAPRARLADVDMFCRDALSEPQDEYERGLDVLREVLAS